MTNEEQKRRIYYLQFGDRMHNEDRMIKLRKTPAYGWTYYGLYMALLAAAVKNNGIIRLAGEDEGFETPAHEIAVLIGAERDEVLLVAGMLHRAQQLKLLEFAADDGCKAVLQFELIAKYTCSTSQGTEYKKELADKKKSETPAIEDKGGEEKEKKPSNRAKAQAEADAMFERLWRRYPKKKLKGRVKPAAKYRLYKEYGEEKCQRVVDMYAAEREGKDPTYTYYGCNFFNKEMFEYLDGDAGQDAGQPAGQPAQPKAQPVTEKTVRDTIMREGIWNIRTQAWDRARLDAIRDKIGPEMSAAIEAKMA